MFQFGEDVLDAVECNELIVRKRKVKYGGQELRKLHDRKQSAKFVGVEGNRFNAPLVLFEFTNEVEKARPCGRVHPIHCTHQLNISLQVRQVQQFSGGIKATLDQLCESGC